MEFSSQGIGAFLRDALEIFYNIMFPANAEAAKPSPAA